MNPTKEFTWKGWKWNDPWKEQRLKRLGPEGIPTIIRERRLIQDDAFKGTAYENLDRIPIHKQTEMMIVLEAERDIELDKEWKAERDRRRGENRSTKDQANDDMERPGI